MIRVHPPSGPFEALGRAGDVNTDLSPRTRVLLVSGPAIALDGRSALSRAGVVRGGGFALLPSRQGRAAALRSVAGDENAAPGLRTRSSFEQLVAEMVDEDLRG